MKKFLLSLILGIFLISCVSALSIDDSKSYDLSTKTFKINNAFGLGEELIVGTLKTPQNVKVGLGYQKVAEFEITTYEDYTELIKEFELIDLKTDKNIERQLDLKVWKEVIYNKNIYSKSCFLDKNGTVCEQEIIGTEEDLKYSWVDLEKTDFLKDETKLISIWTNVEEGDHIEWIPTITTGKDFKINEWATWKASLNVGIQTYFSFEEESGNITKDLIGGVYNLSFFNQTGDFDANFNWSDGIIGNAVTMKRTDAYLQGGDLDLLEDWGVNIWINPYMVSEGGILKKGSDYNYIVYTQGVSDNQNY